MSRQFRLPKRDTWFTDVLLKICNAMFFPKNILFAELIAISSTGFVEGNTYSKLDRQAFIVAKTCSCRNSSVLC